MFITLMMYLCVYFGTCLFLARNQEQIQGLGFASRVWITRVPDFCTLDA